MWYLLVASAENTVSLQLLVTGDKYSFVTEVPSRPFLLDHYHREQCTLLMYDWGSFLSQRNPRAQHWGWRLVEEARLCCLEAEASSPRHSGAARPLPPRAAPDPLSPGCLLKLHCAYHYYSFHSFSKTEMKLMLKRVCSFFIWKTCILSLRKLVFTFFLNFTCNRKFSRSM